MSTTRYIIARGGGEIPLFWSRDGWQGNSYFASRYESVDAAWVAIRALGLDKDHDDVRIEARES